MTRLLCFLSVYVILSCIIGHTRSAQQNASCEYGGNCANAADRRVTCPAGYFRSGPESDPTAQCVKCPADFFNPLAGQGSCFSCGSEAVQPDEGQTTCICRGEGRGFQPSDGRCPCAPGYHTALEGVSCAPIVYDICRDGSTRNHEGKCLTPQEWTDYCSQQVCAQPEHYEGYDHFLGLCICRTEDVDIICNADCRRKQKTLLQIQCVEETPQLRSAEPSGGKVSISAEHGGKDAIIVMDNTLEKQICSLHSGSAPSVYVVKCTEEGFVGVYNPKPQEIKPLLSREEDPSPSNVSVENRLFRLAGISGVLNPTTCIHVNDFIMFIASKPYYPVYDVNDFYNTNPGFDWGSFRTLAEEIWLSSKPQFSLLFQFREPGVYVMKLSNNPHKKMYIRVMLVGGQCYEEGPFFPTTPRHVIRNGIGQMPPILLKPDWPAIAGIVIGLMIVLITCILLLVWFQDLGWTQKIASSPQFRKLHQKFNLDTYSSKGSTVTSAKKLHPKTRIKGHVDKKWDETEKRKCPKYLPDDEFWDYEQQIDMESFSTQIFYDILLKQSFMITSKISHLKEEVKVFYEKLVFEVSTLKETFVKRLSVIGHPKRYSNSVLENYGQKKQEMELEISKRKCLAAEYEELLNKQLHVLQEDKKSHEEHCVEFKAALRESIRMLELMKDKTLASQEGEYAAKWQKYLAQFDTSCNTMYTAVMKESNRLKVWGVLGEGTGAYLVNKDRTRLLTKRDLFALDGTVQDTDVVFLDRILGLVTPAPHSVMLLSSHYLTPVPGEYFVHSETGKVLPIAGNVGYDPVTSQLISTVDSASRNIWKSDVPILPYIPYPLDPSTGLPVDCKFADLHEASCENYTTMVDLVSGLEVPILAVMRHPKTQRWLALGGTYLHPLTNLLSPIEIGGPMMGDHGKIFPILGIGLDRTTGDVIPLGGIMSSSGSILVLGDIFSEPLSGKKVRIQGAALHQDKVVPHAGGLQTFLDTNLMMAKITVIDAMKAHRDLFSEELPLVKDDFEHSYNALTEAVETMEKAFTVRNQYVMARMHNVTSQHKMAIDIKCYGGSLGLIRFNKTELWIPAVLGMEIPDPGPSDLIVPILGVEHDFIRGHLIPLAGTMEDAEGRGLIPIRIGGRTIDPVSGCSCPVLGAETNPITGIIMPVLQPQGRRKDLDFYLLDALQKEMSEREKYWQSQKKKEEELLKELSKVTLYVLDVAGNGKIHKIKLRDRILSLDESCQSLEEESVTEVRRRVNCNVNGLSMKMGHRLPFLGDNTEEKEQQLIFSLVVRKTTEKIIEFIVKMEQESERVSVQLREWQKSREETSEDVIKSRQALVMVQFINEFEDHIMKRLTGVDSAYCRLQYVRKRCKLQGLMAKSYILGTSHFYINLQGSYWSITGREQRNIGEMLVPMLKHLIQIMEENKTCALPPDTQAPVSGYSSRSTLKASAANSDNFQVSPSRAEKCKPPTSIHWGPSAEAYHRQQGYVYQFLMEKQASELIHLERILLTEEISRIWNFYESCTIKVNLSSLITDEKDAQLHGKDQELNISGHWEKLIMDLTDVHRTALKALHEKHQEEVKSAGLDPDTVIPAHYFHRDVKDAILQLALEMHSVYQHVSASSAQGMSSTEAKLLLNDKDSQHLLFHTLAAKFVRQELLLQIHMYNILDAYSKIQTDNCDPEVKKTLCRMNLKPSCGKAAAEEAAKMIEKRHIEKIIIFLKKSFKDQQNQTSLNEMQTALKEEHGAATEQLLQEENTLSLQEMSECPETKSHMDHAVCYVLSQRHFRQTVVLLQEVFKTQQRDEYDNSVVAGQEEILNLFNNKTEARLLLLDLQQVIQRIRLRERHLGEIASGLKAFCSDKVHILSCVEEALYLEYELQAFVKQQLKCLKEELEECAQPERQSVVEEQNSLKGLQEKQAEVEQAHRKQISEENLKLQDQLERGELNGFMKQKLIREHDETVAFLDKTLRRDLEKLNVKLEEELRIKERLVNVGRRHHSVDTDTPTAGKMNPSSNHDQKILSLLNHHINIFHQTEQIAAARTTLLGPGLFSSVLPPDGNDCKIVESSPLLTLLKEVDSQLRAGAQSAKLLQGGINRGLKNTFRDVQDLQSNCEGDLSVVNLKELSARELVTYEYGAHILERLKLHINLIGRWARHGPAPPPDWPLAHAPPPHGLAGRSPRLRPPHGLASRPGTLQALATRPRPAHLTQCTLALAPHAFPEPTRRHYSQTGILHLHITSCIPANNYTGNAFSHSFFYQGTENKLFVPREYLQSVGSLLLLVVHCFAHFVAGDFNDDSGSLFLRTFYQALKVCFTEGFLPRLPRRSSQSQCDNIQCDGPQSEMISKKKTDLMSTVISLRSDISTDYHKPLKTFEEIISGNEVDAILKSKLAPWKLQFFASCEPQICAPEKGEDKEWTMAERLQDELDDLNAELALVLMKELDLRRIVMDGDKPSYQLQIILAEKDCLIKRVVKVEEKVRILSSLV
ncbi:uncharacterized protein ACNLHF_002692 isoform 2-T2 [Anomaloglossus baeobatrachus]|uniref:uncharacterized protein LOC142257255 isoform X2 n=1 Tax=Anomaloglossus baeobatrachus TaxID=238106 RepID=UPI003F5034CF